MMRCSLCYPIFSDFLSCMYGQKIYVDMSCLMRRAGLLNRKLGVSVCRGCTKVTMINKFVCLCQSWIISCALCEALYRERRTWGSWSVCSWTNMLRSGRREKKKQFTKQSKMANQFWLHVHKSDDWEGQVETSVFLQKGENYTKFSTTR
jgi:hypothetical protein